MDRRQKKTKQAIYDAFTHLLEHKTYSNITVQEIIDTANIGRSTFYSHFETKEMLLKSLCAEIFDHIFEEDMSKEYSSDFDSKSKRIEDELTHILYHIKYEDTYIKRILSHDSGEIFMQYFKKYLEKIFEQMIESKNIGIPKDYLLNHFVCDFAETIRWSIKHSEYSPEEICKFFFAAAFLI